MSKLKTGKVEKWAVENTNLDTNESVRAIECMAEWTAKLMCDTANKAFTKSGRRHESRYFKLAKN